MKYPRAYHVFGPEPRTLIEPVYDRANFEVRCAFDAAGHRLSCPVLFVGDDAVITIPEHEGEAGLLLLETPMNVELVIFDLDGTLADRDSDQLYPDTEAWLKDENNWQGRVMFVATNQGGIGLRHWMETGSFGNPEQYPVVDSFLQRMEKLYTPLTRYPALLMCGRYQSRTSGEWSPIPEGEDQRLMWRKDWRKPAPGMLLSAMETADCGPEVTLMVGDSEDDRLAAEAAGCEFMWAWQFFDRRKPD